MYTQFKNCKIGDYLDDPQFKNYKFIKMSNLLHYYNQQFGITLIDNLAHFSPTDSIHLLIVAVSLA